MILTYFKNVKELLRQKLGDEETTTLLVRAVYLIKTGRNDYSLSSNSQYYIDHLVFVVFLLV